MISQSNIIMNMFKPFLINVCPGKKSQSFFLLATVHNYFCYAYVGVVLEQLINIFPLLLYDRGILHLYRQQTGNGMSIFTITFVNLMGY
jgi:hypothetical protein